jgi:CRISPR-associated protein Cas5d
MAQEGGNVKPRDQAIDVWGELACFSRPELKVERFSYPVITPSAARGIFDAIYSKPNRDPARAEFRWQVTRVEVQTTPSYIALRRNEVKDKVPVPAVLAWMRGSKPPEPLWADGDRDALGTDMKGRTQRQTMALKNVRYRLHAEIRPWPGFEERQQAFEAQFRRRAATGKCFYQPYLGCREFPAFFELADTTEGPPETIPWDEDLGLMLYDVFDLSRPGAASDRPSVSLFRATVRGGVLSIPDYESAEVLKLGKEGARC